MGSVANGLEEPCFLVEAEIGLYRRRCRGFLVNGGCRRRSTYVGVVVPTMDAQFWNSYVAFMKKGADELGVKLVVLNADTSGYSHIRRTGHSRLYQHRLNYQRQSLI